MGIFKTKTEIEKICDENPDQIIFVVVKKRKQLQFYVLPYSAKYCVYSRVHFDLKDCYVDDEKAKAECFRRNKLALG